MFYSDLKQNLFHKKIILKTGSHNLVIDLSNDVFFRIFYSHLTKLSGIDTVDIRPKHRSGGCQKFIKSRLSSGPYFSYFSYFSLLF